ncbi:DUF1430 domain-containing protein [Listeria seeligeri]|uniref:DUF1430 domain-containing protein n=1 Tax=Listeria seeligeri TaxID=1640 RepID=A0A7X0X145_LISSE|nr:DUF1430 domain-containing protein [Listeria seeligeri]MBC1485602.1 DUF1430 domain-containing protein [Listeria seeligeri]MBC1585145.1 DUF1430 domain-containing protein [Listeria seeligeri]MBC2247636.1 DUF1430 domain-containing protein [Listeria seeligeri]MBF2402478.1 DUF1430 domain-containing protein [Listeria seeligeri]MBF2545948.1 DUF1430 domain-containing protein [Listeria seeligeri]
MKKFLSIIILITLIIGNFTYFNLNKNILSRDFLFQNQAEVHFKYKNGEDTTRFIESVQKISESEDINISQYTFLDERAINIYSSNVLSASNIVLKNGNYPNGNMFLANDKVGSKNQSGEIYHPSDYWSLKIYNFEQVKNVGLGDVFYIEGLDNKDTYQAFLEEFEQYGEISVNSVKIGWWKYINLSLLMTLLLCTMILCIFTYYYLMYSKHQLMVNRIWGNSKLSTLNSLFFKFIKFALCIVFVIFLILLVYLISVQSIYLAEFLKQFTIINIILLTAIIFLMYLLGYLRIKKIDKPSAKNQVQSQKQHLVSNLAIKLVLLVLFISIFVSGYQSYQTLNNKLENFEEWGKTKDIYKVGVGLLPEELQDDLKKDRLLNDKFSAFYELGKAKKEMFMMYSGNFQRVDDETFYYETYSKNDSQINSPEGSSIDIDLTYLKLNPIETVYGQLAEEEVINQDNVLNIIVPESKKKLEDELNRIYIDYFYFQKVEVANMYNEALNQPKSNTSKKDLHINIIYAKNQQQYFTFDSNTGDVKNSMITDPIAIIYTGNVDSSYIGARLTSSVFFVDETKGDAFNEIQPLIKKSGATEITHLDSVYEELSNEITTLKWFIYQQLIGTLILALSIFAFMALLILAYYRENLYKQLTYYVFGFSFWESSKAFIICNLAISFVSGIIMFLVSKEIIVWCFILVIICIELMIIYHIRQNMINKDIKSIIKGEKYD